MVPGGDPSGIGSSVYPSVFAARHFPFGSLYTEPRPFPLDLVFCFGGSSRFPHQGQKTAPSGAAFLHFGFGQFIVPSCIL